MDTLKENFDGRLIVISAPSGAGKTTICHKLIERLNRAVYSISVTSRPPRTGEVHMKDYFFEDEETFMEMVEDGKLIEWAKVYGHYYGTSREFVKKNLNEGNIIVLDIDVKGALQIKEMFPDSISIFIMPPSMDELKKRLTNRNQDTEKEINKRLQNAKDEMKSAPKYDYTVVNNNIDNAVSKIMEVIQS